MRCTKIAATLFYHCKDLRDVMHLGFTVPLGLTLKYLGLDGFLQPGTSDHSVCARELDESGDRISAGVRVLRTSLKRKLETRRLSRFFYFGLSSMTIRAFDTGLGVLLWISTERDKGRERSK